MGCTTNGHERILVSLPPTSPDQVQIFYERPSGEYKIIAENQMVSCSEKNAKAWAAKVGGNGVIVATSRMNTTTSRDISTAGAFATSERLKGGAIDQQAFLTAVLIQN